jgi:hypothetical protein
VSSLSLLCEKCLVRTYKKSVELNLSKAFINLLSQELKTRQIKIDENKKERP